MTAPGGTARLVTAVVYEEFALLDLAGPADVFHAAALVSGGPGYRLVTASPGGTAVRSNSGVTVAADTSIERAARRSPTDTLLVCGGLGVDALVDDHASLTAIRRIAGRARRTASVCTGALALAAAGLLDGHRATTHWASCERLAASYPAVTVEPDRIYVRDRDRWTSAGVTAGLDLALALVEDDCGPEVAHAVAGWLVMFVRRPGGQSQFSAQLNGRPPRTQPIVGLLRWLPDHLSGDLSVAALAERAGMSPRHFARIFRTEVGVTPASLVESFRIEAARRLLETTDLTLGAIAAEVGLGRPETLHRAFRRRVGTTPDRYRQHFRRRAS